MARIRTIKPEFWSDEKIGPLPPIQRLVFLGLVSQADDGGRLVDSVRLLDGLLFTLTDDSCAESLDALAKIGVIERGTTASGQHIVQIVGWSKHQKVDKPSQRGVLPPIQPTNARRRSRRPTAISHSGESREPPATLPGESRDTLASSSRYEVDLGAVDLGPSTVDRGPWTVDLRAIPEPVPVVDPEPPCQPTDQPDALLEMLTAYPAAEGVMGGLTYLAGPLGQGWAETTLRQRFLYPDPDPGMGHEAVKGLELPDRQRLVAIAMLEFRGVSATWDMPHFAGFVRRLRDQGGRVLPPSSSSNGAPMIVTDREGNLLAPLEPAEDVMPPEEVARILREMREKLGPVPPPTAEPVEAAD